MRPRLQAALTLLELLAAMAILGILAVLAFPLVQGAQMRALQVASSNNLRQLAQANLSYANDWCRFVPSGDRQNLRRWHGTRTTVRSSFDPAAGLLSEYLGKSRSITACPLLKKMLAEKGRTFEDGSGGYGYNAVYLGGLRDSLFDTSGLYKPLPAIRLARPTTTVMFATTGYANGDTIQEYPFCEPPFWDFGFGPTEYRPSPSLHFRFNGKAIVAWCDGHLSYEKREERPVGTNPHGGDATAQNLGWFGPDLDNGYWNPERP